MRILRRKLESSGVESGYIEVKVPSPEDEFLQDKYRTGESTEPGVFSDFGYDGRAMVTNASAYIDDGRPFIIRRYTLRSCK